MSEKLALWSGLTQIEGSKETRIKIGKNLVAHRAIQSFGCEASVFSIEGKNHYLMKTNLPQPFDRFEVRVKGGRKFPSSHLTLTPTQAGSPDKWTDNVSFRWNDPKAVGEALSNPDMISESWRSQFDFKEEDVSKLVSGLRTPQLGALHAIAGHFAVGKKHDKATIVLPTGTGKTETMLASLAYRRPRKVLVLVPSSALRTQIAAKFLDFGILQDIGCLPKHTIRPRVALIRGGIKTVDDADGVLKNANVIVALPNSLEKSEPNAAARLYDGCSELFVDEAHHISARTWAKVETSFAAKPITQFTATPFRQDGKSIGGKIIFNYKLSDAQRDGFYRKIRLKAVEEFGDQNKRDRAIASEAVDILKADIRDGNDHILMARAASIRELPALRSIYEDLAPDFEVCEVHSELGKTKIDQVIERLKLADDKKCRILLCVDMLGEGFDLPQLKIAALHAPRKSLAITLQFIGRFTRKSKSVGDAAVVINLAEDKMEKKLRDLYSQGAEWDQVISRLSEDRINDELRLQEVVEDLKQRGTLKDQISLWNLRPRLSTQMFQTKCEAWNVENYLEAFPKHVRTWFAYAPTEELLVVVAYTESSVKWGRFAELKDSDYDLLIAHWDKKNSRLFVHASDYDVMKVKTVVEETTGQDAVLLNGTDVFKVLSGVELPLAKSLGSSRMGAISFTSYFGPNVTEGLASVEKRESELNNIACLGYEHGERVVWGAAKRKGKIWQVQSASISEWKEWVINTASKIEDADEDPFITSEFLRPEKMEAFPDTVPISIEWGEYLQHMSKDRVTISFDGNEVPLILCTIKLVDFNANKLDFMVLSDDYESLYRLEISASEEKGYKYSKVSGCDILFKLSQRNQRDFEEQFYIDPPIIRYANGMFSYNNYLIPVEFETTELPSDDFEGWDWSGTPLNKESMGKNTDTNTIQYKSFEMIQSEHDIIFNDDGPGEAADLVCLKDISDDEICLTLVHCKNAVGGVVSRRIDNFYALCGQAQKSISVKHAGLKELQKTLLRREQLWIKTGHSRFLKGDRKTLSYFAEKSRKSKVRFSVILVQPGLSLSNVPTDIGTLLSTTELFLKRTTEANFKIVCSH